MTFSLTSLGGFDPSPIPSTGVSRHGRPSIFSSPSFNRFQKFHSVSTLELLHVPERRACPYEGPRHIPSSARNSWSDTQSFASRARRPSSSASWSSPLNGSAASGALMRACTNASPHSENSSRQRSTTRSSPAGKASTNRCSLSLSEVGFHGCSPVSDNCHRMSWILRDRLTSRFVSERCRRLDRHLAGRRCRALGPTGGTGVRTAHCRSCRPDRTVLVMNNNSVQEIFDGLRKHPEFPDDPDLRLDDVGFIVE